jgi:hypothetical protein
MLRECSSGGWYVEFVYQLVQYFESQNTVIDGGLQKFGHIIGQISMRAIIEPSQFGDAADQFNERQYQEILQLRTFVGEISKYVIANIDPLRHCERIPMHGNEFDETIAGHESSVL